MIKFGLPSFLLLLSCTVSHNVTGIISDKLSSSSESITNSDFINIAKGKK